MLGDKVFFSLEYFGVCSRIEWLVFGGTGYGAGDFIEDLIQPDAETPTYADMYASNGAPEGYPPSPRAPGGPPPSGPQQLGPPGMHQMPHHPPQPGHFDQGRPQYQSYNNYPPSGEEIRARPHTP